MKIDSKNDKSNVSQSMNPNNSRNISNNDVNIHINNVDDNTLNNEDYIVPELDESLDTIKENDNNNFNPHDFQSYFPNHIQVVGNHKFVDEYKNIYPEPYSKIQSRTIKSNNSKSNIKQSKEPGSSPTIKSRNESNELAKSKHGSFKLKRNKEYNRQVSENINEIQSDDRPKTIKTEEIKNFLKYTKENNQTDEKNVNNNQPQQSNEKEAIEEQNNTKRNSVGNNKEKNKVENELLQIQQEKINKDNLEDKRTTNLSDNKSQTSPKNRDSKNKEKKKCCVIY